MDEKEKKSSEEQESTGETEKKKTKDKAERGKEPSSETSKKSKDDKKEKKADKGFEEPSYLLSTSPHIRTHHTIERIMWTVVISLLPASVWAIYEFGALAALHMVVCIAAAMAGEALYQYVAKQRIRVWDGSAALTGLLLALNLPVQSPLYVDIIGSVFAIIIVKQLFGGLGNNFMNPALGGRIFVMFAFGAAMVSTANYINASPPAPIKEIHRTSEGIGYILSDIHHQIDPALQTKPAREGAGLDYILQEIHRDYYDQYIHPSDIHIFEDQVQDYLNVQSVVRAVKYSPSQSLGLIDWNLIPRDALSVLLNFNPIKNRELFPNLEQAILFLISEEGMNGITDFKNKLSQLSDQQLNTIFNTTREELASLEAQTGYLPITQVPNERINRSALVEWSGYNAFSNEQLFPNLRLAIIFLLRYELGERPEGLINKIETASLDQLEDLLSKGIYVGQNGIDAMTYATPSEALRRYDRKDDYSAVPWIPEVESLFIGSVGGSMGEISALFLLIGALILLILRYITLDIVLSYIGTVALFVWLLGGYGEDPILPDLLLYHLFTGGLMIGALFMATDMVTSPLTRFGKIIFGVGCGVITSLIRLYGDYPEGVSFSIVLMNLTVPLIDRYTRPRIFGTKKRMKSVS